MWHLHHHSLYHLHSIIIFKFLLQIVCPLQALEFYHQQQTFHFKVFSSENPSEALEKSAFSLVVIPPTLLSILVLFQTNHCISANG